MPHNTYLKFINLAYAIRKSTPGWPNLDALEDRMLHRLAAIWFTKTPITILDAVALIPEVSAGTAYSKIASLVNKGIIETMPNPDDRRVKHITPSALTLDYFSKFDK